MGMSASQVRYCMLQARKSDIEFQGQQINQQRTTLATQSAAYNTELLTLSVPTPPSTEEYTTTTYTYVYNGSEYTIKAANYMNDSYTVGEGDDKVEYPAGTYVINYTTKETQNVGQKGTRYGVVADSENNYYVTLNNTPYLITAVSEEASADVEDQIHQGNIAVLKRDFEDEFASDEKFYQVEISQGQYTYFSETDLRNYMADTSATKTGIQGYQVSPQSVTVPGKMYGATITWTETGRMSSIADSKGRTCALDVATSSDDAAYANAYNEYLYQKDQYNKKMDDINSQLEVIQAQDKRLELQLRNLDTQENAIKTEMDAVKSVCKDNIDKSFSVFG